MRFHFSCEGAFASSAAVRHEDVYVLSQFCNRRLNVLHACQQFMPPFAHSRDAQGGPSDLRSEIVPFTLANHLEHTTTKDRPSSVTYMMRIILSS